MNTLIEAAKLGDKHALEELYRANFQWLFRYVRFNVADEASAEDVCSEVFTKAFENIAKFRAESSFKTWVFAIARNELKNWYRNSGRYVSLDFEPAARQEEKSTNKSLGAELKQVLEQMNERYRHILELRFLSGLSLAESASTLGITTGTAKVLQHRALRQAQKFAELQNGTEKL